MDYKNKIKRISRIKDLAVIKEKQLLNIYLESKQQLKYEQDQLNCVKSYVIEYYSKIQELAAESVNAACFRNYYNFIAQLNILIDIQENKIKQCKIQVKQHKINLQHANSKVKVLTKMRNRYTDKFHLLLDKFEQKNNDELFSLFKR